MEIIIAAYRIGLFYKFQTENNFLLRYSIVKEVWGKGGKEVLNESFFHHRPSPH